MIIYAKPKITIAILWPVICVVLVFGCVPKKQVIQTTNPILRYEVIDAYANGWIENISGIVKIKKQDVYAYEKVTVNDTIEDEDILALDSGSSVRIKFPNGSTIMVEAKDKASQFVFDVQLD